MKKLTDIGFQQGIIKVLFIILTGWWVISFFFLKDYNNLSWAATYQVIAILGAIFGIQASNYWGGYRSLLGRSILFFSLGLIFQAFGQSSFSFYNLILQVPIPYPSIADIGYFGSIFLYIYATTLLVKVSGGIYSLKSADNKIIATLLPLVMLLLSYFFFLQEYVFDWDEPLKIFLDFGYPFGQAIYVSIAILTYILSKKYLGGIMKHSILVLLIALTAQYVADYNFLYQASKETWINGGYGDFLYLTSYFVMTMGLITLSHVFQKIKNS